MQQKVKFPVTAYHITTDDIWQKIKENHSLKTNSRMGQKIQPITGTFMMLEKDSKHWFENAQGGPLIEALLDYIRRHGKGKLAVLKIEVTKEDNAEIFEYKELIMSFEERFHLGDLRDYLVKKRYHSITKLKDYYYGTFEFPEIFCRKDIDIRRIKMILRGNDKDVIEYLKNQSLSNNWQQ